MTDLADKIYEATGLTLNAEAVEAIGRMITQGRRDALEEAAQECEKRGAVTSADAIRALKETNND